MSAPEPSTPPPRRRHAIVRAALRVFEVLYGWARSGWAGPATATWSLLQSSIVPGPSDALLVPLGLAEPKRAPELSLWAAAGAIVGAMIAYLVGALAFTAIGEPLLQFLGVSAAELARAQAMFATKGWIVIALGSLPFLSSKLIGIAAGAFGYPPGMFFLVTCLVRGARFLLIGVLLRVGGDPVRRWFQREATQLPS